MRREIKFRAWNGSRMMYQKDRDIVHGKTLYYLRISSLLGDSNDYDWMQYTGLKDKNGRDVYQGDIFRVRRDKEGYGHTSYAGVVEVTVETCGYSLKPVSPSLKDIDENLLYDEEGDRISWDSSSLWHVSEPENIEVIGNIYENPELLGGAK